MARYYEDTKNFLAPNEFFTAKLRAIGCSGLRLFLVSEEETDSGLVFNIEHGATIKSPGEKITVTLTFLENATRVCVRSQSRVPGSITDFGKNRSNVAAIFKYLSRDIN